MLLKQAIRLILVGVCLVTLVSCSSARKHNRDAAALNNANSAYQNDVESSGIGQSARFGERASERGSQGQHNSRSKLLAKRVYYFDFDSNVVHGPDKKAIAANANFLTAHPGTKVMIEGNTDPRGSREYNIGLGERRAKSVAELLAADGVSPAQLRLVSYGAEKRASFGSSEADYRKDRRVVLVYLKS